jgi:hypothetical protein
MRFNSIMLWEGPPCIWMWPRAHREIPLTRALLLINTPSVTLTASYARLETRRKVRRTAERERMATASQVFAWTPSRRPGTLPSLRNTLSVAGIPSTHIHAHTHTHTNTHYPLPPPREAKQARSPNSSSLTPFHCLQRDNSMRQHLLRCATSADGCTHHCAQP